jgi:hypothetical protein
MRVVPFFLLAVLAGCGGGKDQLYGSIAEIYSLSFDTVQVSLLDHYLIVEYDVANGGGKAAKLTVDTSGLTVTPNASIDLTAQVGAGLRGTLQQILTSTIDLPMQIGTLSLSRTPQAGAELSGHFRVTLSNPMGRTFNGDFDEMVKQL